MTNKDATVAERRVGQTASALPSDAAELVTVVSLTPDGTPAVRLARDGAAVPARLAVRTTLARIETAILLQQQAVVVFESGDRSRPIILGFLEAVEPVDGDANAPDRMPAIEADVDGKRVRVTAEDEIVLECGSASVTLRRNGRVIIRGTYVETRSEGTNRIKGGQVQIN